MNVASTFVRITASQSASEYSVAGARRIVPALFTRMSMGPAITSMSIAMVSTAFRSDRSATTSRPPRPSPSTALTVSDAPPRLAVAQTTSAPATANASAIARPRPRLAPVTSARWPLRSNMSPRCEVKPSPCAAGWLLLRTRECRASGGARDRCGVHRLAVHRHAIEQKPVDVLGHAGLRHIVELAVGQLHVGDRCVGKPAEVERILALPARHALDVDVARHGS